MAVRFRPGSAALEYRPDTPTSTILSDVAYTPYSIEPQSGTVLPGKKVTFKVKFSPLDVQESDARLICSIPNLEQGKQGPTVLVKAKSLMPYCHFELADSDYITSARRNPELRGPGGAPPGTTLDPNTRVIEFDAVGVGVKTLRRFNIVNPTTMRYTYTWENNDEPNPKKLPDFRLEAREGEIRPGKKTEIVLEFTSSQLGIVESFMTFHLTEHSISVPFLLVGSTRDCNVSMDRSHLNFKSLLIGHEAIEIVHIQNSEDASFPFAFDAASCHSPGFANSLKVEPMHGVVPARGSVPVKIYFTPNSEKEVNFNLVCEVKRKTLPLTLNVKAEGYSMNCLVLCEDLYGNKVELTSSGLNAINFGEVEVNEKSTRNMYIINSGKFNFDYTWELRERSTRKMVTINPAAGGVMCEQRACCKLSFCPPVKTTLRGCDLVLKISNGPRYDISVLGEGVVPGVHFSFSRYDFGACFIHRAGMPTRSVVLHITNRDRKEVSIDCLYSPTAHLHHNFEAKVIPPGQTEDVTFTFYPREAIRYKEVVTFEINGLSKQSVEVHGQGTEMRIEVANPRDKMVRFGALRVGQTVKRTIPIINNSPAPITFHLGITPSSALLQDKTVLRLTPTHDLTLHPRGGTAKVDVVFSPKSRIPPFTEEVMLECAGLFQPLFVVSGSCQGIEISLDSEALPFGAVVQKSSSSRKLLMINTGDIGARFKWEHRRFEPDFTITPTEGYISPGMEVPFEVTFHPQEINQDIRYQNLKCQIEGSRPLLLTLTGMCIAVAPGREIVHFSTNVRHAEKKKVMVANKTNMLWNLRPVIDGEYWTGPETFTVEPQQIKGYELKYKPLTMTSEGKKHTGTVFFPMPDGNGVLYNLTGVAEAPKPIDKISTREIPCKTVYTHMLPVENWLKKPQRFKVRQEMIRPEKLDAGTMIKGLDYIDVPGNSKRDYKLTFHAHREGITQMRVVFTNETTGEYQHYEIQFKAGRPGVINTISLSTPVRQSVPHTLMLENPLHYPVTFAANCNIPEIMMPNQMSVPAQSDGAFNIEYLPLKVGETQGRLEFNCNDLGLYIYDLNLRATKAGPERALYFRTGLGTSSSQSAKFLNFAKQKTDYTCKVDNNDFHVDKALTAAPGSNAGTEVAVEVVFEPSRIGESRGTLTVSSTTGGDYTFPLFGTCTAPKPQGPFTVKAGTTTNISFRNVFSHSTPFTFQVDNPLFHVAKTGETIRSRKDHRIVVGFDGNDSGTSKASVMGKLVVSCAKSAGGATNAQWVYYLKGVTPEGK